MTPQEYGQNMCFRGSKSRFRCTHLVPIPNACIFFMYYKQIFVYLCITNNLISMDERVIKNVNEARWTDGQIVRSRLDDIKE